MVFLKLEVSCVFAASPMARCLGPKATRDLWWNEKTKDQMMVWNEDIRSGAVRDLVDDDIDSPISRNTDL